MKFVLFEQLGAGLITTESQDNFKKDFFEMHNIVASHNPSTVIRNNFLPKNNLQIPKIAIENEMLNKQQLELFRILLNSKNVEQAKLKLYSSSLNNSDWKVENWKDEMLEMAISIGQKWN